MPVHTLATSMFLPLARDRVFAFFSDASNLARITPPEMGFQICTSGPIEMSAGTVIEYRVRVFGLPLRWRSLISRWEPEHEFVDEQIRGPYKSWIHTHRFLEQPGGTLIEDDVCYAMPFGPLGEMMHPLVKRQLKKIFQYRQTATEKILLGEHRPS